MEDRHGNGECQQSEDNPSEALRKAHGDVVVVMNRDRPDALMVGIESWGRCRSRA
jgi:hypothetical protein